MLQCSVPPATAVGAVPVAVATASAGRSAAHARLVGGDTSHQAHLGEAAAAAVPLSIFRYAPGEIRRRSASGV